MSNTLAARAIRPNRYAAQCAKGCGARVAVEAGALVKTSTGWGAEHIGACPVRAAVPAAAAPVKAAAPAIADGYYAVHPSEGRQLCFYRVTTKVGGRWDGMTFANRFKSDEELPVSRAEREHVLALIGADPEAARRAFAESLTRCYQCGRMLTDEVSIALGIGPDCRARA